MTKDTIAYYTDTRVPMSLNNLVLFPKKHIEDIFDAVEDSEDFDELTDLLRTIISEDLTVDRKTDRYIRYIVTDVFGNHHYLKIKIKENRNG